MNGVAAATAPANDAHAHDKTEVDTVGKLLLADAKLSPEDYNARISGRCSIKLRRRRPPSPLSSTSGTTTTSNDKQ